MSSTVSPIEVQGTLSREAGITVTIFGRERIQAVSAAFQRHLGSTDEDAATLERAVASDRDDVELTIWNVYDARVLADVLDDVRNGDDPWPARTAQKLRNPPRAIRDCPYCDGTGEVEE